MQHRHFLKLALEADIVEEIEIFIQNNNWQQAQEIVRSAGEGLAKSLGRDNRELPYSFWVILSPSNRAGAATRELYALQILYKALASQAATQT